MNREFKLTAGQLAKKIHDTKSAETKLQTHSLDRIYDIVKTFDGLRMLEREGSSLEKITFKINTYLTENVYS